MDLISITRKTGLEFSVGVRGNEVLTDRSEKDERQPVIPALDPGPHRGTGHPTDNRHQGLKEAEVPGQAERLSLRSSTKSDTDPDRDGKRVHCQAESNTEENDVAQDPFRRVGE